MLKFLQNTLLATVALVALVSAMPAAPAHAQSAPAGLLRLDPPQPSNDSVKLTETQRAKLRNVYAHARKHQVN
jgi:Spy/CpxP family protein refolding chaperone